MKEQSHEPQFWRVDMGGPSRVHWMEMPMNALPLLSLRGLVRMCVR